jgi:hypothetical protein
MGFGESARRVARELAKAHPESARAQWSLGWVLSFDTVGRDSAPGADFAGAEKAYRAALARDPDESLYYRALGVALERRALRARVSDPAALRETIQLYEQLRGKLKNHEKDADLLRLHLWQGDFQEVARLAEGVEASEDRNAWWVTALAANVGAQAALHKAEQLAQNPAALIERASAMLAVLGRYEQAYALSQLPNVRKSLAVTARTYAAARDRARCESTLHPAALTVARWYREMLGDARGMDAVRERLEKLPEASIDRYSLESAARSVWDAMNRSGDGNTASAAPFVVDIFPCYVRWEVEEKNGAVRVKLFQQGAHDNEPPDVFYARKLGSTYSLVAFRMKGRTVGFSRAIFQALADKRVDEARTWLGWALDETKPYGGDAASYGFYDAVRSLTPSDPAHADEEDLSTLAAIFASGSGIDGRELKVLERAAKRFTHVPAALRAVSYGRSWLLPNEEGASQAALLAPLHQAFPEDGDLWQRYALALYRAKEYGSLSHELDAYDRKYPGNTFAPNWRNYMDWRRGQYGDVIARTQARLNEHRASRGELNNAAWNALFAKTDVHAVIGMAEAACEPEADASLEALHTLATLYAEVDEHDKAHTKLRGIIDRFGDDELSSSVWYTWGRLAEGLGLGDDARAAYTHVEKPEHDSGSDVFVLAQRRLAQLQTLHR